MINPDCILCAAGLGDSISHGRGFGGRCVSVVAFAQCLPRETATALLAAIGGPITRWAQLLCQGVIRPGPGRVEWQITERTIQDIVDHFDKTRPVPLEDMTQMSRAPSRGESPTLGWVTELRCVKGELWGRIEFTSAGLAETEKFTWFSAAVIISGERSPALYGVTLSNNGYPFAGRTDMMVGGP